MSHEHNHDEDVSPPKHYINMSNERIDRGFDILDKAMVEITGTLKLNYYEILTILTMMETKVINNNHAQYLLETVTRFQQKLNEEDEKGK